MLCDKFGGARTISIGAIGYVTGWGILLGTDLLPMAVIATLLLGVCAAGILPPTMTLMGHIYGQTSLPRAYGLFTIFSLPFTVLMSPAAGALHDVTGNYAVVMIGMMAYCGIIVLIFLPFARLEEQRSRTPV